MRAVFATEVAVELHETRQQVALGDHDVDGKTGTQLVVQFPYALAYAAPVVGAFLGRLGEQIRDAKGDDGTVQGLARPEALEQFQESAPCGAIHGLVAGLGGVAAGGVEQHRFIGEPPIAVAGAAHAANGTLAQLVGERKTQTGVDEGGGLAGAGCADEQVPGELVEVAVASLGLVFEARLLEGGQGLQETQLEIGHFPGGQVLIVGVALG